MQVQEMLFVTAEEFFDLVMDEIAIDITNTTGRKIKGSKIQKGFTYSKKLKSKMGKNGNVKVTVTKLKRPEIYQAKFDSATGINYITYEIEKLDEPGKIGVTYREEFEGASKAKSWNYKLMMFFYNRKSQRKAIRLLRNIESYIKQQKETADQPENIEEHS